MYLSLDKAIYAPGEIIKVRVIGEQEEVFVVKFIGQITISIHKRNEHNSDYKNEHNGEYQNENINDHETFSYTLHEQEIETSELAEFAIPKDAFSSIHMRDKWSYSFGEIEHKVQARTRGFLGWFFGGSSVPVIIRNNNVVSAKALNKNVEIDFYPFACAWCCCFKRTGTVMLSMRTLQDTTNPGDTIEVSMGVDNTENSVGIVAVEFILERRWLFRARGERCFGEETVFYSHLGSVQAWNEKRFDVMLTLPLALLPSTLFSADYSNSLENRYYLICKVKGKGDWLPFTSGMKMEMQIN